jgi:hypothetical protein
MSRACVKLRIVGATVVAALALAAAALAAEAPTRDEYVSRLERICKPNELATQRAMKGSRDDISAERLDAAAAKFAKATQLFGATVKEIGVEPRPPADVERLRKWFVYLGRQEDYLRQITAQLRAGRAVQAQRLTARFIHNGNLANNVVLAFGFDYCSFKFSRFG